MASSTKNVKMGVCRLIYDGQDLGYTKGGVEFSVTTETHKVMIDQFGNSEVDEVIMSRSAKITAPLAETTLENLAKVMPGASFYSDGERATGTITFADSPADGEVVTVNGVDFTFKTTPVVGSNHVALGVGADASAKAVSAAANLLLALQSSSNTLVSAAFYALSPTDSKVIKVTHYSRSAAPNAGGSAPFTLAETTLSAVTVSAGLTGGVDETQARVDVERGVGTSLLSIAKELRVHPIALADDDYSQDVILPKTAAAGALSFAFKVDQERTFPVEFNGYPDTDNQNILFQVGDKRVAATSANLQAA